jgi:hypothetical protein
MLYITSPEGLIFLAYSCLHPAPAFRWFSRGFQQNHQDLVYLLTLIIIQSKPVQNYRNKTLQIYLYSTSNYIVQIAP